MDDFHGFNIVQMVPNRVTYHMTELVLNFILKEQKNFD